MKAFLSSLLAGFRWWMVPVLVLLMAGIVALFLLSSLSGVSSNSYTIL